MGRKRTGLTGTRLRALAAAAVFAAGIAVPGCVPVDRFGMKARFATFSGNRFIELSSSKDQGRISLDTCICFYPDGSFDFDLELGDLRGLGEAKLGSAIGGFELSNADSSIFGGISWLLRDGGMQLYSASHLSAPGVHGSTFFPGARRAYVRAARDESGVLGYFARVEGDDPWTPLGSSDFSSVAIPLSLKLGAFNVPKGGRVGFDRLYVNGIGTLLQGAAAIERLGYVSYETLGDLYDRYDELEAYLDEETEDLHPFAAEFFYGDLIDELEDLDEILDLIEEVEANPPAPVPGRTFRALRADALRTGRLLERTAAAFDAGKDAKVLRLIGQAMASHTRFVTRYRELY